MKACILSMQKVDNMGSLLQAYGLKKCLEQLGCEVEFMDIAPQPADNTLLGGEQQDFSQEKERGGILGKLRKLDRYALNRILIKKKAEMQNRFFEAFRENELNIVAQSEHYELCVIGSDEVFNCLSRSKWGFTSQLFGNVPEAEAVITYAASCGSTTFNALPQAVRDRIQESFQNISGFSVRDENTLAFTTSMTSQQVELHLDPVAVTNLDAEVEAAELPKTPKRYCIIYSYYNRIHSAEEIAAITSFCAKHKLTPVTVGAPQHWVRDYIACTPFQCLKLFRHADFVITDTFHGTIFSAKYAERFAVLPRESNRNKLCDLIRRLGVEKHCVESFSELEQTCGIRKDDDKITALIAAEHERTLKYLGEHVHG